MAESNWLTDALRAAAERMKEAVPEIGAELGRLGVQGQMEMANALFNGSAFVPYGPGQYTPPSEPTAAPDAPAMDQPPPAPERGGMER